MTKKKKIMDIIGIFSIVIVVLCFICIIVMSFVIARRFPVDDYAELLTSYADHKLIYSIESIISFVSCIFILPATITVFINFYSKIKQEVKNWLLLPTIATLIGTLLLLSLLVVKLVLIFKTAPAYISAIEPAKSQYLAIFENRVGYLSIFQVIAYMLLFTVGTGGYGILSFKYQLTKDTSTWLAIFTAFFGLGELGVFIPSGFGSVLIFLASIASILYFFWLGSTIFVIRQNMKENVFVKSEKIEKMSH
ncbi:MAG: hypothetical protein FK732_09615 [Asgard group archaeon]|nr:hypothetical protein [Asgard group archaeon]